MGHPLCTSANRVLVVDDCADTVSTLAWLLSSSGFHVLQATSAEEALSHADRFQPDAVLLDLSLGGQISGFEVARRLRRLATPHRMRIAAVTGWSAESYRREAAAAGCDAYFVKPVDITALGQFIRGDDDTVIPGAALQRPDRAAAQIAAV